MNWTQYNEDFEPQLYKWYAVKTFDYDEGSEKHIIRWCAYGWTDKSYNAFNEGIIEILGPFENYEEASDYLDKDGWF